MARKSKSKSRTRSRVSKSSRVQSTRRSLPRTNSRPYARRAIQNTPDVKPSRKKTIITNNDPVTPNRDGLKNFKKLFPTNTIRDTLTCAKRKIRKEVLFAQNKAGTNGMKKRKITERSNTKCF